MTIREIRGKKYRWIHIDEASTEVEQYLRENFKFHPLDIEDVTVERQRPKIDVYKYYLFLVCLFPRPTNGSRRVHGCEVDIFLTADTLITISEEPFPPLDELFTKGSRSQKLQRLWLDKGPAFLLYKILQTLYRGANHSIESLGTELNDIEVELYDHEFHNVASQLAHVRRTVLGLRRLIDPQRLTIATLVNTKTDFIPVEASNYFDDIRDEVEKLWGATESYKDTIDGLHLTNEALISQHTNETIKILTIISVAFMPLTLLSGIYGMNIDRLPYAHDSQIVFGVFAGLAAMIFVAIIYIYRRGKL